MRKTRPADKVLPLWVLGPGTSLNHHESQIKRLSGRNTLAFQGVFPHCYKYFGLIPSYWFSADPNAWMEGFEFLCSLSAEEQKPFKNMIMILPHYVTASYSYYRQFGGTTPLGRISGGWDNFLTLLKQIKNNDFKIKIIECLTTKYIHLYSLFSDVNIFNDEAYVRFMHEKPIFGTVPFDSESVVGTQFKWGLENKLTTSVFPISYFLGAKDVYIAGFDFKGGRFYDIDRDRHPWNDESQARNAQEIPLALIKKWADWHPLHGMRLYNVVDEEYTLLSSVLPYRPMAKLKIKS